MKNCFTLILLLCTIVSCTKENNDEKIKALQEQVASLKASQDEAMDTKGRLNTYLTFQKDDAEEAMNFYISLFDNSKIIELNRWGKNAPGKEGKIMHATFSLNGSLYMCSDSPPIHEWDFSPAVSNYVECTDEKQLDMLFDALSSNGQVMMPRANYGFSKKFAWVEDRFGVSWQLNWE